MQANKLFVANMSFESPEDEIRALFEEVGEVLDFYYPRDRETGRVRGFAFVTMASDELAQAVIEKLHGHILYDRDLRITVAIPRENRGGGSSDRPRGHGGGGFRGRGAPRAPRLNPGEDARGGGGFRGRGAPRGGERGSRGGRGEGGFRGRGAPRGGGRGDERGSERGGRGGERGGRGSERRPSRDRDRRWRED